MNRDDKARLSVGTYGSGQDLEEKDSPSKAGNEVPDDGKADRSSLPHEIRTGEAQIAGPDVRNEDVDEALREELGEGVSPRVLEHVLRPRNAGLMANPDGEATLTRACGDGLCIQLRLQGNRIQNIRFMTNGCGAMVACGSVATELARGKSLREALTMDPARIMDALQGLPPEEAHCAALAANALKAAVRDALGNRTEPWKRLYRSKWGR